mgnify:CR=1 FL=1
MSDEQWTTVRRGEDREWGEMMWNERIPVPLGTRSGHEKQRARKEHRD